MTQTQSVPRRAGALGVHSIDHFCFAVPDLKEAEDFYTAFGLDVRKEGQDLGLYTFGHPHRWGLVKKGPVKKLLYISFGIFADDEARFRDHFKKLGVEMVAPPAGINSNGIWIVSPDGLPLELKVAEKATPNEKSHFEVPSVGPGKAGTIMRSQAQKVHPRRLSHFAIYTTDVLRDMKFYIDTIGLRLSDYSGPIVAFLHGVHGSDHHLLALVGSNGSGFHHSSWDVGSIQDIGLGASQMAAAGFARGWGLGRHVLGANYFYYVRDPWGSHAEYSADIDYIPVDCDWPGANYDPEDSFYLWGPNPPEDFVTNFEAGK